MFDTVWQGIADDLCDPLRCYRIHAFDLNGATREQLVALVLRLSDDLQEKSERLDGLFRVESDLEEARADAGHFKDELERVEAAIHDIRDYVSEPVEGYSLRDTMWEKLDDLWYTIRV